MDCLEQFGGVFASEEADDGTVFIDRDPDQFVMVLEYLRYTQVISVWDVGILSFVFWIVI